jgi:cation diffusion facilitator family transporter
LLDSPEGALHNGAMASSSSKKVVIAALIGNSAISVTKFIAASITGSSAMFSEGIHSLVDTGNQVLLLVGMKRAQRPATPQYPFGFGKEIYFWGFVVAILIFAVGSGVSLYEGFHRIQHPEPVQRPMVNFVVLGLALIFEGSAWLVAYRALNSQRGRRSFFRALKDSKDPGLFVVLFEDTAAMLGLLVALGGLGLSYATGNPIFDGVSAMVIGIVLGLTAFFLAIETKSLLLGESAEPEVVEGIRGIILNSPEVEGVNEVLTMHMGPNQVLANISVKFKKDISAENVEDAISKIDAAMREAYPEIKRIFIEAEASRRSR